jgi:di/tricarboxylate transporter
VPQATDKSGLADDIAKFLVSSDLSPETLCYLLYLVVLIMTEIISNNSAATLSYPIAMSLAKTLEVDHMAFVMVIIFASTCAFAVPMGYQCHLMVMGPGDYTFRHFLLVGLPMDFLILVVVSAFAPTFFPFHP